MSDEVTRKAFEVFMSSNGEWPKAIESGRDGYKLMATASAWNVWQAATRAAVPAWQPIETAPRGGKRILVYEMAPGAHAIAHILNYPGRPDSWVNPGCHKLRPTHWMPLPPAPKEPT